MRAESKKRTSITQFNSGWAAVQRYVGINLETSPLEIETDAEVGSLLQIRTEFQTLQGQEAGGVYIFFDLTPRFWIKHCSMVRYSFPTSLPATRNKIWRITKTRSSEGIRLQIHCNDVEVVNFILSDKTCGNGDWKKDWDRSVGRIFFIEDDNASDYYKLSKTG